MSTQPTAPAKILVLSEEEAAVVISVFTQMRVSAVAPEHRKRLPSLMRALGRFHIAEAGELREERAERQHKRKAGQSPKQPATTADLAELVAASQKLLLRKRD